MADRYHSWPGGFGDSGVQRGLGINGHVAFHEAAEADDPITADEFAALGTRVLRITRETRAINAFGYQRGDLAGSRNGVSPWV